MASVQLQLPLLQACPAAQGELHEPQFEMLVFRSTQALPHGVRPAPQVAAQEPALQKGVAPSQRVSQLPQLFGSEMVSMQALPQLVSPAWQPQLPPLHC